MRAATLAIPLLLLAGCGGGGGSGGQSGVVTPAPSAPTPTPTSTPTPVQASVDYLYVFGSTPGDGTQPNGYLLLASDGNFYGTTRAGGTHSCFGTNHYPCGTVFKVTPAGVESVLYEFGATPDDAYTPESPLVQGSDGALYGTTSSGGAYGAGTVFRITLGGSYSILYSFGATPTDGVVPIGGLVQGNDGSLYGLTASGGANHCVNIPQAGGNCGTMYKVTPAGVETVLYSFGGSESDAVEPFGTPVLADDGNLYGVSQNGGANACSNSGRTHNCGTVFRVTTSGTETVLYSFGASPEDGIAPSGVLFQGRDGALYGTTLSGGGYRCGGSFGCGTIFRITTSGDRSILYSFSKENNADGEGPKGLMQAADGNLYGTASRGGTGSTADGTAFRLTPSGSLTTLYVFGPRSTYSANPIGSPIERSDGALYGMSVGALYKLTLP